MTVRYYIRDMTATGDLCLWWRPDRCGYTTDLDQAGVYSEDEANKIARIRGTDKPYPVESVSAVARRVVFR